VNAGWPAGRQRVARTDPPEWRPIGSRVDRGFAKDTGCNFLGADILDAVTNRLRDRQDHQTLDEERLWCDLLSSMPMCFNLFGSLWNQPELAAAAVGRWFPDLVLPGSNVTIHFEWSPGRRDAQWLGDRTAFDAMIEIVNPKRRHLIGIETKYHEYPNAVTHRKGPPARYLEVTSNGGLFSEVTARELVWGQPVEQIWRDHLLALACGQHPKGWDSIHYVLLAPASNPAWVPLVEDYVSLLQPGARGSIEHRSLESLLDAAGDLLPHAVAFRARYLEI
jgi:hypothetical protein